MTKNDKQLLTVAGIGLGLLMLPSLVSGAAAPTGAAGTLSYLGKSGLPLGMKRNNPGNIVRGANYQGELFLDQGRFAQFESWAYGIRAMITLLIKYITKGSSYPNPCVTTPQNTIRLIINQWAPKLSCGGDNPDNAVDEYVKFVSAKTGFPANQVLTADKTTLRKLVMAMSRVEQGRDCVTPDQFNYAYSLL